MITHKKKYGVYHWDTFDNETILIEELAFFNDAKVFVNEKYAGRIGPKGADRVDIVDNHGTVVASYSVG